MKHCLLYTILVVAPFANAQEPAKPESESFNRWSVDAGVGVAKPMAPFHKGLDGRIVDFYHIELGGRYMVSDRFGVRLSANVDNFQDSKKSPDFNTHYSRFTIEAVANMGKVLNFQEWRPNLGLLIHAGTGYSSMGHTFFKLGNGADEMVNFTFGFTPQYRINDRLCLQFDATIIGHMLQSQTFDLKGKPGITGLDGYMLNGSLGITYYFGKNAVHADWFQKKPPVTDLTPLETRMKKMEADMLDGDADGVPNYLDQEPDTPAGATVNTKGQKVIEKEASTDPSSTGAGTLDGYNDLYFTVQLGVYSNPVAADVMKGISPLDTKTMPDGKIRYFTGVFHSVEEAKPKLEEAKKAGILDAFITAYYKGQRITCAEANTFIMEKGPSILQKR